LKIPALNPRNQILAALSNEEYGRLAPVLERVDLELKVVLFDYDQPIEHVYFPEDCIGSVLSIMSDGTAVEAASVGREGMVGLPIFLGATRTQAQALCQVPGAALRMKASAFREAVQQGGQLSVILGRYTQALFTLLAQSSACNRLHTVRKRCARCLLMTQDRVGRDQFPLTQQFLSQMLGVRRATVTEAAGSLQASGLIEYAYGQIHVTDRPGLEATVCECYTIIQREFELLLENREVPSLMQTKRFSENGLSTAGEGAPPEGAVDGD
jgi:CRP-like cAMP-binding protein